MVAGKHIGNATDLKANNSAAILRTLYDRSLSRSDLGRACGLTRAAVSDHIREMIADALVYETGSSRKVVRGRKPILLEINPSYAYFGGIYLSRSVCRYGITDLKGNTVASGSLDEMAHMRPNAVLDTVSARLLEMAEENRISPEKLAGIGVSVPGPVNTADGVILIPPKFGEWHRYPICQMLTSRTGRPVYVENNAAACTLAELHFGAGRTYESFLYLLVDSGIGGGIVVGGRRLMDRNGFGSEIGHTSIQTDGRYCDCGNRGCLERYASIPTVLRDYFAPEEGVTGWAQVVDMAEEGDKRCCEVIEHVAEYLSTTLITFINALEPQAVVLSGDLRYRPARILALISKRIQERSMMRDWRRVEVLASELDGSSDLLSAANIAIDAYIRR
ncbi:MAG: ROK family transcriptional regulator [Oscillospiraceae bacterium]|nr:ROK family transcriptional regulator [Oscillospiraceae bacterium]